VHAMQFGAVRLTGYVAAVIAGAAVWIAVLGTAQPAAAQQGFGNIFGYDAPQRPRRRAARRSRQPAGEEKAVETGATKKADKKVQEAKKEPSGPIYAVISLGDQHISVYEGTERIARSRVSTGQPGHATPPGVYSVIGRSRYHYSNLYGGAPMPWMQRITWSGVAMHAGVVPGYPASHGCIRLPYSFAPQMWNLTHMGSRVIIARRDTTPATISHPFLPLPKLQIAPSTLAAAERPSGGNVELASLRTPATTAAVSPQAAKPLNPIEYAAALKERATSDKADAEKAMQEALAVAQGAGAEARQAVDDVRKAQADVAAVEAKLAELDAAPAAAQAQTSAQPGDPAADKAAAEAAATARTVLVSEQLRARAALEAAIKREAAKTPAAFAAVEAYKNAVAASDAAAETLKQANRRQQPVSVLVSREEGRIFVRQDWQEVYEAPVTIRDPDRPLGTHVYIATGIEPDGSAVRWSAVSMPSDGARAETRRGRGKGKPAEAEAETPQAAQPPETAAGALDRIEWPAGVRERVSELLWTGASLTVSDHPRSGEMSEYSDFIIKTR
jgi:lipoprotein-anchoring transpeptidase ErfK/SrfK